MDWPARPAVRTGYRPIFLNGPWLCHIFGPAPLNPRTMQVWPAGFADCQQPALGLIYLTLIQLTRFDFFFFTFLVDEVFVLALMYP